MSLAESYSLRPPVSAESLHNDDHARTADVGVYVQLVGVPSLLCPGYSHGFLGGPNSEHCVLRQCHICPTSPQRSRRRRGAGAGAGGPGRARIVRSQGTELTRGGRGRRGAGRLPPSAYSVPYVLRAACAACRAHRPPRGRGRRAPHGLKTRHAHGQACHKMAGMAGSMNMDGRHGCHVRPRGARAVLSQTSS